MYHPSIINEATYATLKKVFEVDDVKKHFALAGGTSLALQLKHRHSIDLDIFSTVPFDTYVFERVLTNESGFIFKRVNSNKNMLFAYINSIKCDFIYEPSKLLQPFLVKDTISYFSIADITAMKMHTICGRRKKKDFFDVYVLLENFGWEQMLQWFVNKYDKSQLYFLYRSIHYFEDANEDPDITGIAPYTKNWDEIKEFLHISCKI